FCADNMAKHTTKIDTMSSTYLNIYHSNSRSSIYARHRHNPLSNPVAVLVQLGFRQATALDRGGTEQPTADARCAERQRNFHVRISLVGNSTKLRLARLPYHSHFGFALPRSPPQRDVGLQLAHHLLELR